MNIIDIEHILSGDPKSFFKENNFAIKHYTSGEHNLSVDGTGVDVSVGETVGLQIAKYLKNKFQANESLKTVDLGTGKGHLVRSFLDIGVEAYGIDGSLNPLRQEVCGRERLAVCDLSKPLNDERLKKAFHFTTSFELFEHIHRTHEDVFLRNLVYLSDYHVASINVDGWPGVVSNHCNIKHPCCWMELFRKYNIDVEVIGGAPKAAPDASWRNKPVIPVKYNKNSDNEEFRDNVRFGQWDEWRFSMFVVLNLKNYNGEL